ncbi:hypothetical protein H5410_049131 [Solanum commersonii]|uniref:Uncharacterized protein n=1 Tax=Solanum commersonii TaxID=4109 RepID=A0A9J5XK82_SOLCO|nr:hypothetical protein H5410_049131 [Solanum commersonii]
MLDICIDRVAREGDISPRQQRSGSNKNKKKTHGRQHSWNGKMTEEFVPKAPINAIDKAEPFDKINRFNKIQQIHKEGMNYQVLLDRFEEEDKRKLLQVAEVRRLV